MENYEDQVTEQFNPILQKDELSLRFHVLRKKYEVIKDRYSSLITSTKTALQNYCLTCCQKGEAEATTCDFIQKKWNPQGECFSNFLKFLEPNSLVFNYKNSYDKVIEGLKEAEGEKKERLSSPRSALKQLKVVEVKNGPGYVHPGLRSDSECKDKKAKRLFRKSNSKVFSLISSESEEAPEIIEEFIFHRN